MKDTVVRSIVKTFFFKVVTTGITAIITGLGTALLLHTGLTIFYLIYERIWNRIEWGKVNVEINSIEGIDKKDSNPSLLNNNPHCGEGIKVVTNEDGRKFIWKVIGNEYAKEIWNSGLFTLYALHEDNSESMVEGIEDLIEYLENGVEIGIEVGFILKQ